jgi:glutathione S-transferase
LRLRLHDYVLSAECYTVRLMLALLGVSYEKVAVDAYPGNAEAPVLYADEAMLTDPGLILTFLALQFDPLWLPADGAPGISHWLAFAATELAALNEARRIAVLGKTGDFGAAKKRGRAALRVLEDALTDRGLDGKDWLAADEPSIADVSVFPAVALSHDSGIGHEDYPAINLWQRRVRRLPGFVGMPGIPDYF